MFQQFSKSSSKQDEYNNFNARPFTSQMWSACCVSKSPRFSYTSAKYRIAIVNANASLLLAGRQTLHTQWFERFLLSGGAVRCLYVVLRAFCCGARRLAKRYVCAAKQVGATFGNFFVLLAEPPNATYVHPGCFRRSRLVMIGPIEGCQTLRT